MKKKKKTKIIGKANVLLDNLYFQYDPNSFCKKYYKGDMPECLLIKNSPHFDFLETYNKINKDIWKLYNETSYIKMMKYWGRGEKHNIWKVKRFLNNYNSIKKNGIKNPISVLRRPMHNKALHEGFEIYHGHHRATICFILGYKKIPCVMLKVIK